MITISSTDSVHIRISLWNVPYFATLAERPINITSCFNIRAPWRKARLREIGIKASFLGKKKVPTSRNSRGASFRGWARTFCFSVNLELFIWLILLGIDNRTERTRYRVNYDTTYQKVFERVNQEAVKGKTKHLLIMLGKDIRGTLLIA